MPRRGLSLELISELLSVPEDIRDLTSDALSPVTSSIFPLFLEVVLRSSIDIALSGLIISMNSATTGGFGLLVFTEVEL